MAPGDGGDRPPLILADKRTNALIVSGRRADVELASKLTAQLDVDTQANKRVFVYYVENVKAKELATTLTEIFGKPGEGATRTERRDLPPGSSLYPGTGPGGTSPPSSPVVAVVATPGDLEPSVVEGQVKVVADEPNNALIITTFPRNWPLIEDTIRKLDRIPKQVLIEVLVAEVGLTDENRLGIEWAIRSQRDVTVGGTPYNVGSVAKVDVGPLSTLPGGQAAPTLAGIVGAAAAPATAGFSLLLFETDRFLGLLNLYANYGQLTVLSSPTILTSENKKAVINVSNSVPIVTQQVVTPVAPGAGQVQPGVVSGTFTQSVEYRDAGIILTVTPRISDKRVVALDVKQTVNDVGDPRPPSFSPDIIKREAETSVVLRDNQTLVLGGLIRTRRSSTKQGIPWLSKIPVIGWLFGATADRIERTELLLLITPRVIGDPSEGLEIYQQVRGQRPGLERDLRLHPSILQTRAGGAHAVTRVLATLAACARLRRRPGRAAHVARALALVALLAGCEGGSGQSGSAFVFLSIDGFSQTGTNIVSSVTSSTNQNTTTIACVTLRNNLKNPTITGPSPLDNVIIQSYTVTLPAAGGRAVRPVHLRNSHPRSRGHGGGDDDITSSGNTQTAAIILVPAGAKGGAGTVATAEVRFSGHDGRGNSINEEGAVTVLFEAGAEATVSCGGGTAPTPPATAYADNGPTTLAGPRAAPRAAARRLPAEEGGPPGEAGAEGGGEDQVALPDPPLREGLVDADGDRGRRRVPVLVHVVEQLVLRDLGVLGDRVEDALVRLVEEVEVDVLGA